VSFNSKKTGYLLAFRKLKTRREEFDEYIEEMIELCRSADIEVIEVFEQTGLGLNTATYLNKGKINEIAEFTEKNPVDFIITSHELSSLQYKNIVDLFPAEIEIVDRAELIFFIFKKNARTNLGKVKVELAQLEYEMTKMTGHGVSMSRLGAGIGTRGLGEQKRELDRRYIKNRVKALKEKIKKDEKSKDEQRKKRLESNIPLFSLVGYTNVGKTSLLNALLKNDKSYVKDKFFATLEPKCKKLFLTNDKQVLINDSVGFINDLPDKLFESFMTTSEEITFSDFIIVVLSPDNEIAEKQKKIIDNTLKKIGCDNKPQIIVYNKCDLVDKSEYPFISAKEKINIEKLKSEILEAVPPIKTRMKRE